jgi:hypothetical protein
MLTWRILLLAGNTCTVFIKCWHVQRNAPTIAGLAISMRPLLAWLYQCTCPEEWSTGMHLAMKARVPDIEYRPALSQSLDDVRLH